MRGATSTLRSFQAGEKRLPVRITADEAWRLERLESVVLDEGEEGVLIAGAPVGDLLTILDCAHTNSTPSQVGSAHGAGHGVVRHKKWVGDRETGREGERRGSLRVGALTHDEGGVAADLELGGDLLLNGAVDLADLGVVDRAVHLTTIPVTNHLASAPTMCLKKALTHHACLIGCTWRTQISPERQIARVFVLAARFQRVLGASIG